MAAPRQRKRKRGAIAQAKHDAALNKKDNDRRNAEIMSACAPTWQDNLILWGQKKLKSGPMALLKRLAETHRQPIPVKNLGSNTWKALHAEGVVIFSEGFIMISKKNVLNILECTDK